MKKRIFSTLPVSVILLFMLCGFFHNALAQKQLYDIVEKKGKWGLKSESEWRVQPVYEKIAYRSFPSKFGILYGYFAWSGGKIDLYHDYTVTLLLRNVPEKDTAHVMTYFEFASFSTITPFWEDGLCGWKYQQSVIPAQFDSIHAVLDYKNDLDQLKVYKNGMLALVDKNGTELIPPGNYTDLARRWAPFSSTYLKDAKTGQLLEGLYFDKSREIPPRYTKIEYITSFYSNGIYSNTHFYYCELPDGGCDCFVMKDSSIERLSAELETAYCESRARERSQKTAQLKADAEKRVWLKGLKLFAKGEEIGIKEASGKIVLPATAMALVIGKLDIDPDGDTIKITNQLLDNYSIDWAFTGEIPLQFDTVFAPMTDLMKNKIMAELNPYNSISGDYKLYFDVEITPQYDYTATIYKFKDNCPLCEGSGQIRDGYTYSSETFTYDRTVKDGTTTITRKNYLANERVSSNGTVYTPEYTQTYDNYKTVQEEKTVTTATKKYKTCTLCEGKKRYSSCSIEWDKVRNEYVLKGIWF